MVSQNDEQMAAAIRLHLDEELSLRTVESITGVSRSRLARHAVEERKRRHQEEELRPRRLGRLRTQGKSPNWLGWVTETGTIQWGIRPWKLNENATIPKDGRETLADCLWIGPRHQALRRGGAIPFALDQFRHMDRAFKESPTPRRGPNQDARNILVNMLCGLHDDHYCGPDEDRDVMRAEFVKAALEIVGAPCWKYEPRNGKAPLASQSKLRRLVKRKSKEQENT